MYPSIRIGDQVWMTESLRTTKYKDGSDIAHVTDEAQWSNLTSGAYCWYNNNNIYDQPGGKLYNWYTVQDSRGLCPDGWRVPSEADFNELTDYLGGKEIAGGKMKQEGTSTWDTPNVGATNSSKFTAIGFGFRYNSGPFSTFSFGTFSQFWTTDIDENDVNEARTISLNTQSESVLFTKRTFVYGIPVRCLK